MWYLIINIRMQYKHCYAATACSGLVKQLYTEVTKCHSCLWISKESTIPSVFRIYLWGCQMGVSSTHTGGCWVGPSSYAASAAANFPPTWSLPPFSVGDWVCRLLVLSSLTQSSEIQCIKWVGKCWKVCIILSNSRENIFLETIFPKMV